MKRVLLLLAAIPTFLFAQNITNTLGTNGTYIVEDENNSTLIRASRSPSTRMIFGDFDPAWTLPAGDIDFIHNEGSEKMNIVVGRGTAFNAIPKLQFYFTPGPLSAPTAVTNGEILGIVSFNGYSSSWTSSSAVQLTAEVDGAPSGTFIPGVFTVSTSTTGGNVNAMSFNSQGELRINPTGVDNDLLHDANGNLTVAKAITSQAIKDIALNVDNGDSYNFTLNDQTVIFLLTGSGSGNVDVNLPAASTLKGKTYTIKRGSPVATRTLTLKTTNSESIDGSTSYVLSSGYSYVTVQSDGSKWWVVGEGTGN
jgi:hypothetical protein